jgi:hypothetical protein
MFVRRRLLRAAMIGGAAHRGGPMQLLVVEVEDPSVEGQVFDELVRLSNRSIALIDVLLVRKTDDGTFEEIEVRQNDRFGAMVGSLIGLRAEGSAAGDDLPDGFETWYVDDEVPPGSAAIVALIEHKWAAGLAGAIVRGHGVLLSDAWLHPDDVSAVSV